MVAPQVISDESNEVAAVVAEVVPAVVAEVVVVSPPEADSVRVIPSAVNSLRDARIAHDDAGTRKRKAAMAKEDAEVARSMAADADTQADEDIDATRDDVLAAFDALIAAVQGARDAFRAG